MPSASEDWATTSDERIDGPSIDNLSMVKDDLWLVIACVERVLETVDLQRRLLKLGIARSAAAATRVQEGIASNLSETQDFDDREDLGLRSSSRDERALARDYFANHDSDARICLARSALLHRLDRVETFSALLEQPDFVERTESDDVEFDPWGNTEESTATSSRPLIPLTNFQSAELQHIAVFLALEARFKSLSLLMSRHAEALIPFRFTILESIPESSHPADFRELLPAVDPKSGMEILPLVTPSREPKDWCESSAVASALLDLELKIPFATTGVILNHTLLRHDAPLSAVELSEWYRQRIRIIERTSGFVDIALAFIQHGASHGVPNLDELGEDLSLLARLVYDTQASMGPQLEDWTLERWRVMPPLEVTRAYLAHSTPSSVTFKLSDADVRTSAGEPERCNKRDSTDSRMRSIS